MRTVTDWLHLLYLKARLALSSDEHGQDLAEYGLIIALIAIVAIAALTTLGTSISSVLNSIAAKI
ncbi:MAG: Flp family type IVb pilin [Candidatus Methanomethylicaceae archaeon]